MSNQVMIYTGIGSRETPDNVLSLMCGIAQKLAAEGYTLRSGGANGADSAFEAGCNSLRGTKEIYLPWRKFNGHGSYLFNVSETALEIASKFHPGWRFCSDGARKLHARNVYQVLGQDLKTPSQLVICWTREASSTGGTGQAIRIARHYGIPIHDLGDSRVLKAYAERLLAPSRA